jgi:hypothetical protein
MNTTCYKRFADPSVYKWREINWAVSSSASDGALIEDPSCSAPSGCFRNKATRYRRFANDPETEQVGYTSVLPDGRYVEMIVSNFVFKNLDDLTTLGETLTKRVVAQQFPPTANARPRSDETEGQLCALIDDETTQFWLGGPTSVLLVERYRYSKDQLPGDERLSGKNNFSCKRTRDAASVKVNTDCSGVTGHPIALFDVGKYQVLLEGKDAMGGEVRLNGNTVFCVDVLLEKEPTKMQRAVFKTMMTKIATELP